jgi:hypothetical protein
MAFFVVLILILLLAGWIGYRFVVAPHDTKFALGMMYAAAVARRDPPLIAASGVVDDGPNWMMPEPTGSRFTSVLRRTFPVGSRAARLREKLADQGFVADTETECRDMTQEDIRRNRPAVCSRRTIANALRYDWGGPVCNRTLRVSWSAGQDGRLTAIRGSYDGVCL